MNISGNYKTEEEEINVVKYYLDKIGAKYIEIKKYSDANAGDVMVRFENNLFTLFEVKQESEKRFEKYGEYGIDFISSCIFKEDIFFEKWKGINKNSDFLNFMNDLDFKNKKFKWGKIFYSYADVWLFYSKDENNNYLFLECYSGKKINQMNLFKHLSNNCNFAVNLKNETQCSFSDKHHSATFYINPKDLTLYKLNPNEIFHEYSDYLLSLLNKDVNTDVFGNKDLGLYHLESCKYLPKKHEKRIEFRTMDVAASNGFKPCNHCIKKTTL